MKVATLGTSFITKLLIQAFLNTGNEVVAVHSRSIEKAKALANEFNISKTYDDFDLMLKDANIDTIYIGLPNGLHFEYAKKCLLANKNVILEKPFTSNLKEAKELFDIAISKHLYLFEAILTIHCPLMKKIKEDLNKLGKIHLATFNFTKYSSKYDDFLDGKNPNVFNPLMAGGALMDLNIYNIHAIQYLFGDGISYQYFANKQEGIDTSGIFIVKYDNFVACGISGKDSHARSGSMIMGENGYIEIDSATSTINNYTLSLNNKEKEVYEDNTSRYDNEIVTMNKIIENDDYQAHLALMKHTLDVMEIVDKLNKNTH